MFLVDELVPDFRVLEFISAAELKQGLQRVNEMTDEFNNRDQPVLYKLGWLFSLALLVFNFIAPTIGNYPGWAVWVQWAVFVGVVALLFMVTSKQEKAFIKNVETELEQVWNKAVAQGVRVKYSLEHSSAENNTFDPAAVTITLP